jgi:integrase
MSKRGNLEGSIYKRADGRWVGVLHLGYADGKRQRKSYYGETRRDVQQRLTAALRDQQQGIAPVSARLTVGVLLDEWLQAERISGKRVSGYARLESCVRSHLKPALATAKVVSFGPKAVDGFIRAKVAEGCAPSSIRLMVHCLRRAFGLAERYGYIPRGSNPAVRAALPPLPEREPRALTVEEAQRLLEAARGDRLEALYVLALTSGLRISELCGLRWADIDLEQGTITIRRKLLYIGKQLVDDEPPKRDDAPPTLPLHSLAATAIGSHRARQAAERLAYPDEWARPDLVFTTREGKPKRAGNVASQDMPRLLKKAGLKGFTPHSLRASAATIAAERGEDIAVVQRLLRHKDAATTMRYYRAVRPSEVASAVARLGDALRPAAEG